MAFVKKLCDISQFDIECPKYEINEIQIQKKINEIREEKAILTDKEGPVTNGDIVYVSFTGTTIDGEKFQGSDADNIAGVIGEGDFIEGFEQQLIGHYKGDNFIVIVTPREDHFIQEVAGKELIFDVTINRITYKELPELNNYFVKQLGIENLNTVDDLLNFVKENLEKENLEHREKVIKNMIINHIIENSEIEVTPEEVSSEAKNIVKMFEHKLFYEGLILSEYLKAKKMTKSDLEAKYREEAVKNVKIRTVIDYLVEELKIEISDEELSKEADKLELEYGYEINGLIEMGIGKKEVFRKGLKRKKVVDVLFEKAKVTFI